MFSDDQIKTGLANIFLEATGFDPFQKSDLYLYGIKQRFALEELDIVVLAVKIEVCFRIDISNAEIEKLGMMNINQVVSFISSKCSKH